MDNIDGEVWYAWYPVRTEQKRWAWLRKVIRVWNPKKHWQILDPYDYGDYVGGWEYHG